MKVANVTDLKRFGEFVDDRIEDDDLLDKQEIAEIVAAIDRLPEDQRPRAIETLRKAADRVLEGQQEPTRKAIVAALQRRERDKLMASPDAPVNKARNTDFYTPSDRVHRYTPNKEGVKLELAASEHVTAIIDTGKQNATPFVKAGLKYDSEHLTAYGVYDAAAPVAGGVDAGFKLKTRHWFLLGETNTLAESNARLYRGYTGVNASLLGSDLEAGAFAGYAQGIGLGSRYSAGYGEYDLGVVGVTGNLRGRYQPVTKLYLGYEVGGALTTGQGLKYPDGTRERLEFSQNGNVNTLPVTGTLVDAGIWAGLTSDEEHARVDIDYEIGKKVSLGTSVMARTFALTTTENPALNIDMEHRGRYKFGSDSHIEANVRYPLIQDFDRFPTIYKVGVQAGPNVFAGAHMGIRKGLVEQAGSTIAVMPDDQRWNVNLGVSSDNFATNGILGFSWNYDQPSRRERQSADSTQRVQRAGDVRMQAYASHRKDPQVYPVSEAGYGLGAVPMAARNPAASFETVVGSLVTPAQVAGYDSAFIKYDRGRDNSATYSPRETFRRKDGVCRDHSRFQAYVLNQHGYEAYSLEYGGAQVYHSIVVYKDPGGRWHAMEYGTNFNIGADSWESVAASLQKHFTEQRGYTVNWLEAELVRVDDRATIDQIRSPAVGEILDRVKSPSLKY